MFLSLSACLTVLCQLDRITRTQLQELVRTCVHKFLRAKIEPGANHASFVYLHVRALYTDCIEFHRKTGYSS